MLCTVDDCLNEATRGGLCWGHARRRRRRKKAGKLGPPKRAGCEWDFLTEAALAYADADPLNEERWRKARDNLRKAAIAYGSRRRVRRLTGR